MEGDEAPNVILVDDEEIILRGGLRVLEKALPNASIVGFTKPAEAVEYARFNRVAVAFLDIEMGAFSGLDLCRTLLEINPRTNVVFLTAYRDYSFDAWKTGACGYLMKPLTPEDVQNQMTRLRFPIPAGSAQG
jgi:two-component SAPR family response regulator